MSILLILSFFYFLECCGPVCADGQEDRGRIYKTDRILKIKIRNNIITGVTEKLDPVKVTFITDLFKARVKNSEERASRFNNSEERVRERVSRFNNICNGILQNLRRKKQKKKSTRSELSAIRHN
jgi:hypothetical protein